MEILNYVSVLTIPLLVTVIVMDGILKKRPVYSIFLKGAAKGLKTTAQLLPAWIGLLTAAGVLRGSGLLDKIVDLLGALLKNSGFPTEILPVLVVRLFSASAATGLTLDLFQKYGPDSDIGLLASIFMSCTETVFYTMSVYFLSVNVRKTRHMLPGALFATVCGIGASVVLGGWMCG